jgi:hypothetical protein
MNDDDLTTAFPIGAHIVTTHGRTGIVVGHQDGYDFPIVVRHTDNCTRPLYDAYIARTLTLDPGPCPITEPTEIRRSVVTDAIGTRLAGPVVLTLHPAEDGATEGRYTWKAEAGA